MMSTFLSIFFQPAKQHWAGGMGEKEAVVLASGPPVESVPRRFLGMTNQLSKFSPKLAETSKPLRDLLSRKNMWSRGVPQRNSFNEMKRILSSDVAVLALYDPEADSRVSADASSYGVGAVLEQQQKDNTWRPVAYQSRSLSACE